MMFIGLIIEQVEEEKRRFSHAPVLDLEMTDALQMAAPASAVRVDPELHGGHPHRGVHMKHTLWLAIAATMSSLACGEADLCVDGAYDGTVVLEADGYVFAEPPSLFSPGSREVIPYAQLPFATCRRIGGLFVQRDGAVIDSGHYPLLEDLGFIAMEPVDNGGERVIDDLSGFDGVVRFGGISGSFFLTNQASIREISGFNAVEHIEGSLLATALITGFSSLREVDGSVDVAGSSGLSGLERIGGGLQFGSSWDTVDLPNLREVGGDLLIEASRAVTLEFPSLARIGGSLLVDGNSSLERWGGLANGSRVDGDFIASFNNPIKNKAFEDWMEVTSTTIGGTVRICANGTQGTESCSTVTP